MIHKYQHGAPVYVPDLKTLNATRRLIGRGTKKVAEYGLKGLGWIGEALNNVVTAGASSDFGQTSPFTFSTGQERRNILKGREQIRLKANEKIGQGMTWASPLNYGAALWNGHGLNAEKGAEEISTWDPRWQLLGRVGEMFTIAKGKPTVKAAVRTGDKVLAKAGSRGAKLRVISRELGKNITEATKNGRIEVTNAYFEAPDKWYRVSERPEKIGIEQNGKNVTTSDDPGTNGTINGWRESMLSLTGRVIPGKGSNEGYFIFQPRKISLSKHGAAHGNTSQAAKGQIWQGTFAFSDRFPIGIIEGQAPIKIFRGMNEAGKDSRTNFVLLDWENVPRGARVGFHTGEMPMSNLGWFLKTNRGTFTYEPIIAEKRIEVKPSTKLKRVLSEKTYPWYRGKQHSVNEVVNPDGTVNPRLAMKILHEVSLQFPGSYKMEHRLENPEWHKEDPNTYEHTKRVAQSAWKLPTPKGYTKLDLMISALGHDFGKIISGDGHAQIGADLAKQVFIGIEPHLLQAIREHMGQPTTQLGEATKAADILNGRDFNYLLLVSPELYNKIFRESKVGERPAVNGPVNIFLKPIVSKDSKLDAIIFDNGYRTVPYPSYINHVWKVLKEKGIKTEPFDRSNTNEQTLMNFFNKGFTPVFKLYPGNNTKAQALETLRRMQNFGMDIDNTMGELPGYGKRSIRDLITLNSGRTSYVGYYDKSGTLGSYFPNNGVTILDPGYKAGYNGDFIIRMASTMLHERNMHGTEKLLTSKMWKPYEDFISSIFKDIKVLDNGGKKVMFAVTQDGLEAPINKSSLLKLEARATLGELRKKIYDTKAYELAIKDNQQVKKGDVEKLRPYFEKAVDEMDKYELKEELSKLNDYGRDYAAIGPINSSTFFNDLRELLKIAPASLPFLIPRKEEKK